MKIEGGIITFKSTGINYLDECSGKKNWTFRRILSNSNEHTEFSMHKHELKRICIQNKETGSYFTKDLSLKPIFLGEVFLPNVPGGYSEHLMTKYFEYGFCWE